MKERRSPCRLCSVGVKRGQNHRSTYITRPGPHYAVLACACAYNVPGNVCRAAASVLINALIDWSLNEGKVKVHCLWPKVAELTRHFWISTSLSLNRFIESHKSIFWHIFIRVFSSCVWNLFFFLWDFYIFVDFFFFALVCKKHLETQSDFLEVITQSVCMVCEEAWPRPPLHTPVCRRPIGSAPSDTPASHLSSAVFSERRHFSRVTLSRWVQMSRCSWLVSHVSLGGR